MDIGQNAHVARHQKELGSAIIHRNDPVVDAVVHSFAVDYARKVAEELRQYNIGQVAVLSFSTFGLKSLAAFGTVRWSGLMLATVITAMLVKFGGSALAHLAGSLTGGAASGASSVGHTVMDPKGASSEIHSQTSAAATLLPERGWVNRPWSERTTGSAFSMHAHTGGGMGYGSPQDAFNASYYSSEEKIVLTGDARIIENENQLGGDKITLFMRDDRSVVESGKVLLYQDRQGKPLDSRKRK